MNPLMGAPTHPLLGAADNYAYPMTNGLLSSMSQPNWTQVALGLAGNPHAGPYANAQGLPSGGTLPGSPVPGGSSSTGSGIAGGILGALAKDPAAVKGAVSGIEGLFGGGLSALGAHAAAATAAELGSAAAPALAADTAAALTPAIGAAPTAAELGTTADAMAPISTSAASTASTAAPSALSTAGYAMAGPAAFAAMYGLGNELNAMFTGQNNNYSIGQINDMLGKAKSDTGLLNPKNTTAGSLDLTNPNGSPNSSLWNALSNLDQLQFGDFGQATPYVQQQLGAMGYQQLPNHLSAPVTAGVSPAIARLIQRA